MSFDPFGDFETCGYLRNVFGEKDPDIIKHLEHSAFVAGIAEAFKYLGSPHGLTEFQRAFAAGQRYLAAAAKKAGKNNKK